MSAPVANSAANRPTEPVAIPAWEADAQRLGTLPPVSASTVREPEYIRARLDEALARAAGASTDSGDDRDSRYVAAAVELAELRRAIENLSEELRPHSRTGEEMLADLNRAHPDMRWHPMRGGFCGSPDIIAGTDDTAVAASLALRLPEVEPLGDYYARQWRGVIEGWRVSIAIFPPYTQR